ncbi:MAG: hypothetical protein KA505_02875 [Xanthomonadales bacterium]|nr:hypothetical protein [Xanthomonadales bacterium]MBP6077730.1 hypothetical protein [Xanthomonadales bacterium]MBP7622334.1 hypothetical protein [Xanthomonadales bacterium]
MTQALFFNILLLLGGLYFVVRNIRLLRSETALRAYMESSPKAVLWVRKYGLDGATKVARESFIPLGLVVSAAMIGLGAWNLWRISG